MSKIKGDAIQIGSSVTASQNCTLTANGDGTFTLARGNIGATTDDLLTIDANGVVTAENGIITNRLVSETAITTTSGTEHDFTNIPSWVKRITVMFNGVSTNGTSSKLIQLGDSGGVETTGYLGASSSLDTVVASSSYTTGFGIRSVFATSILHGSLIITNIDGDEWVCQGTFSLSNTARTITVSGSKILSATLDRIRITTLNGTDTFDAGAINIQYE